MEMGGESFPVNFLVIEEGSDVLGRSDVERLKLMSWNAELGNQLSNCVINEMDNFYINNVELYKKKV